MKSIFYKLIAYTRRTLWSIIVAYMLGLHNFYTGEDKTTDNIVIRIEVNEVQDDGTPKVWKPALQRRASARGLEQTAGTGFSPDCTFHYPGN